MKTIFQFAILFLLCAAHCRAGVAIVQHVSGNSNSSSTQVAATITATGAGHLLIITTYNTNTATVSTVADTKNTYVQGSGCHGVNSARESDVWYVLSSISGATTVTVTFSGTAGTYRKSMEVYEVSSFQAAAFDVCGVVNGGLSDSGSIDTGASVTTTSNIGFVVGWDGTGGGVTLNPNTGNEFTTGGDVNSSGVAACSLISSSASAHQPVWKDNGVGVAFVSSTVAFKETAASCVPEVTVLGAGKC